MNSIQTRFLVAVLAQALLAGAAQGSDLDAAGFDRGIQGMSGKLKDTEEPKHCAQVLDRLAAGTSVWDRTG